MSIPKINNVIQAYTQALGKTSILEIRPTYFANSKDIKAPIQLSKDVFESSFDKFKKLVSKLDFNNYANKEYFLGEGVEGTVYRIADTNYVFKKLHHSYGKKSGKIDMSKLNFKTSSRDKINHIVGYAGDVQIMDYISGNNTIDFSANPNMVKAINELTLQNIKHFFEALSDGNSLGLGYDMYGANCILDTKTGKLTPIDFSYGEENRLLDALMSQLISFNLKATEQNELLKKSFISLLELVKEGRISPLEISDEFRGGCTRFKDTKFLDYAIKLYSNFIKNPTKKNIDIIIQKMQKYDKKPDIKIPNDVKAKMLELDNQLKNAKTSREKTRIEQELACISKRYS